MCVNRKLKKHEGLKPYFLSASGAGDRFKRLEKYFLLPNAGDLLAFSLGSFTSFDHIQ